MPLSEQEQRLLDEMERHLLRNDADVVSAAGERRPLNYRNLVYGSVLVLLGLVGLLFGIASDVVVIGVVGFVAMLGGVLLALSPAKSARIGPADSVPQAAPRQTAGPSFMDRMNERWDRRQEGR